MQSFTRLWNALIPGASINVSLPKFESLLKHLLLLNPVEIQYPKWVMYFTLYFFNVDRYIFK